MVVQSRDLLSTRLRRWIWHAIVLVATLWAIWSAAGWTSRLGEARAERDRVERALIEHREGADRVAAECGLEPFGDKASLEHFPLDLPPFPTRREMECGRKVSEARSDLIEDHLALERLAPVIEESAPVARKRWMLSGALALLLVAGVVVLEVLPRRR
jgi:hypothetical protein